MSTETLEPQVKGIEGRAPNGRFVKGYRGGPGGSHNGVLRLRSAIVGSVTRADLMKVWNKALADAQAGDRDAAKFVFEFLFGKPTARIDMTLTLQDRASRLAAEFGLSSEELLHEAEMIASVEVAP